MYKVIFHEGDKLEFKKANPKTKKKYEVKITFKDQTKKPKIVRFGSIKHEHYHDRIGFFLQLDHHDVQRRKLFYNRFRSLLKKTEKYSPMYFSAKFLW